MASPRRRREEPFHPDIYSQMRSSIFNDYGSRIESLGARGVYNKELKVLKQAGKYI
jgi:hypothetical protein